MPSSITMSGNNEVSKSTTFLSILKSSICPMVKNQKPSGDKCYWVDDIWKHLLAQLPSQKRFFSSLGKKKQNKKNKEPPLAQNTHMRTKYTEQQGQTDLFKRGKKCPPSESQDRAVIPSNCSFRADQGVRSSWTIWWWYGLNNSRPLSGNNC